MSTTTKKLHAVKRGDSTEDFVTSLAKVVAKRRRQLSLSQEEVGHRSKLHRTYISDIERGARNLSLRSLMQLAEALEIRPWQMLALAEEKAS